MPITRRAIKKLKHDRIRSKSNKLARQALRKSIKNTRAQKNKKNLSETYSMLDKSAKRGIIHKKKASRLKSRLSRKTKL